jgi:general secretion pathway protein A
MYMSFFGLAEKPFAITPDPRYLYLSERHAEALAHLLYGIDNAGGFVQLTGEVGTGKTTTIRSLLAELPAHADVALILNPRVTPEEFLLAICDELHVRLDAPARGSIKSIVDALNAFLLDAHARGRRVVLIVDEAQQLSADVLEQVRLLTNLETSTQKLLQIILVGQPELREVLSRNDLRQLAQRITGRYHLDPLSRQESAAYVRHRLKVAGATGEIFSTRALGELHRLAAGVPRLINVIADRALLGAYTREQHRVTPPLVRRAAREVAGRGAALRRLPWFAIGAAVAASVVVAFGVHALIVAARVARPAPASSAIAATPVPVAAPAAPPVAAFLAAHKAETGTDTAFARLFALWGGAFHAVGDRPCEQALAQGLECLADRGSLAQLRLFNRPAIVALTTPDGVEHQVVVTSLDERRVQLDAGGAAIDADILDVERYWLGDFLLLWRPPLPLPKLLRPGMRGPEIRWLRQGLAVARGESAVGAADLYDPELQHRVEEFQRGHRLTVDGIAGVQTQVVLDALVGTPGTPTLGRSGG